ncbi:hypothetical protein BLNAU_8164 [Blattamonas nauphoetae]|uniref:Uncharacterized protein n=1 Tax=Blattamonas nauphoetae TaxID=2049346 RepID=A0ABQ9XZG7_9EUKA|nr:hypothetical protein BLNAU_8164 [Blattamonas nauphoetae]
MKSFCRESCLSNAADHSAYLQRCCEHESYGCYTKLYSVMERQIFEEHVDTQLGEALQLLSAMEEIMERKEGMAVEVSTDEERAVALKEIQSAKEWVEMMSEKGSETIVDDFLTRQEQNKTNAATRFAEEQERKKKRREEAQKKASETDEADVDEPIDEPEEADHQPTSPMEEIAVELEKKLRQINDYVEPIINRVATKKSRKDLEEGLRGRIKGAANISAELASMGVDAQVVAVEILMIANEETKWLAQFDTGKEGDSTMETETGETVQKRKWEDVTDDEIRQRIKIFDDKMNDVMDRLKQQTELLQAEEEKLMKQTKKSKRKSKEDTENLDEL